MTLLRTLGSTLLEAASHAVTLLLLVHVEDFGRSKTVKAGR
jgi:hypothetical protein